MSYAKKELLPCAAPPTPFDPSLLTYVYQDDGSGGCVAGAIDAFTGAVCNLPPVGVALTPLGWRTTKDHVAVKRVSDDYNVDVTQDAVVLVDASGGSVTIALGTPGVCNRQDYWIKRVDAVAGNTVTVAYGGGAGIDGCPNITLGTPGPLCATAGESIHVVFDGAQYWII